MSKSAIRVQLKDASYSWHEGGEPVLEKIAVKMKQGQMLTVFGEEAGSGKTSLLYALMEELTLISGSNEISGSIGFIERETFMI
jgi:ABC-type Mn2+/Zn2+ transport system ATPase subunit